MKKILLYCLIAAMVFSSVACTKKKPSSTQEETTTVDLTSKVSITIPANFYKDVTAEEIKEAAKAQGFLDTVVGNNGEVVYTMTEEVRQKMLKLYKDSIDREIKRVLEGDAKVESFKTMKYSGDYTEISLTVDGAKFASGDESKCLAILFNAVAYQVFAGVDLESVGVTLKITDASSKKAIATYTYGTKLQLTSK